MPVGLNTKLFKCVEEICPLLLAIRNFFETSYFHISHISSRVCMHVMYFLSTLHHAGNAIAHEQHWFSPWTGVKCLLHLLWPGDFPFSLWSSHFIPWSFPHFFLQVLSQCHKLFSVLTSSSSPSSLRCEWSCPPGYVGVDVCW